MEENHSSFTVSNRAGLIIILLLTLIFMVAIRLAANTYYYGRYHVDEYHTIHQGLNLIVNGRVENFRTQEGTRWLTRLFYPYALIKMNTLMGGNVWIDDWHYPGHRYLTEHFVNNYDPNTIKNDPNLRDFLHYLRIPYILFVAFSFFLLSHFLFKRKYYLSAVGLLIILGLSSDFVKEQTIFYVEPALLALINLMTLIFLYCLLEQTKLTRRLILGMSFLTAFALATKFSAAPYVFLPAALILWQSSEFRERLTNWLWLFLSLPLFYALINFPAFLNLETFNSFLHDLTSNFWQYAAGSRDAYTVAAGWPHLQLIMKQFWGLVGPALYLIPLLIIFGWYKARLPEKKIIGLLLFVFLLTISSLALQRIYFLRNALPFYTTFIFLTFFTFDIIRRDLIIRPRIKRWLPSIYAVLILGLLTTLLLASGDPQKLLKRFLLLPRHGFLEIVNEIIEKQPPATITAIGFEPPFFKAEPYQNTISYLPDAPDPLHNNNYLEFESKFSQFPTSTIVMVQRIKNNKHLTNYILPKYFKYNRQSGNYYVFYNEK